MNKKLVWVSRLGLGPILKHSGISMATPEGSDITTDDITTDQYLFYAAVKQEVDVQESSQPLFAPARVKKEEPVESDEMLTCDDGLSGNFDILLPPIEEVFVDPPSLTTEQDNEDLLGPLQLGIQGQIDPLQLSHELLNQETSSDHRNDANTVTTRAHKATSRRIHPGVNLFCCSECNYIAQRQEIIPHLKTHSVEKRHRMHFCTECDYRTASASNLTNHMRRHTVEKSFACSKCEYRTAYSQSLTNHMKRHTGEKPFACSKCEYRTAYSQSLTNHMRRHTGERPFACEECGCRCAYKASLATHMKMMHS